MAWQRCFQQWPSSYGMHPVGQNNPCGTKESDRDASGRAKSSLRHKRARQRCIQPGEIIPVEQKSQIKMHSAGRNNPCGTKELDRDESDRGKVIPVEQKSPIGMHPGRRNHPYGTEKQDRDADNLRFICPGTEKGRMKNFRFPHVPFRSSEDHTFLSLVSYIFAAICLATYTPLAEAWDSECVMPLPSPIIYRPS